MKTRQDPDQKPGKVQTRLMVAVMLATAAWSPLQAGEATVTQVKGEALIVFGGDGLVAIEENGDGTAAVEVQVARFFPVLTFVSGFVPDTTEYEISTSAKLGQSGKGSASGSASAIIPCTITTFGPFSRREALLEVHVDVSNAANFISSVDPGATAENNPSTGDHSIDQENSISTTYIGSVAGSYDIVDFEDGSPVAGETDVEGLVGIYSIRSIVKSE